MKVIKRDGREVDFDPQKIERAIEKANDSIEVKNKRIGKRLIHLIATEIAEILGKEECEKRLSSALALL